MLFFFRYTKYIMTEDLKRYYLKNIPSSCTILVVGGRKTGKTVIIKNILYNKYKTTRIVSLVSATAQSNNDFKNIVPDLNIYEDYNTNVNAILIADQFSLKQKIASKTVSENVKKDAIVVFDDIIGTNSKWMTDDIFKKMIFSGRHAYITNIISVQSPKFLPSNYRDNIDFILVTNISTQAKRKFFWENFYNHDFGDLKVFNNYFNIIKKKNVHNFMLLSTKSTDSLQDYMYWGRCPDPKYYKPKRIGLKYLWDLNDNYFNEEYLSASVAQNLEKYKNELFLEKPPNIKLIE